MAECCEEHKETKAEGRKGHEKPSSLLIGLLVLAVIVLLFNQYQISGISKALITSGTESTATQAIATGASVIPTGMPAVYGNELKIRYDDVSPNDPKKADATISVMGNLDRSMQLSGDKLSRYIKIVSQISCEYCCGAKSIIFDDGEPACGCAHSFAMRGLAKYLLTKHPDMSDDAVLEELGKWKTLFFPGIMQQKADIMRSQGIQFNYINLASNKYRGIEKGTQGGSMVGGC